MANTDSRLLVTDLDFNQIKTNLINFLKADPTFTDYNFNSSALSILIDLLAYNTHMNAYYLNMTGNEMFLDTALLRDSVVSQAKALGYTPISTVSPHAVANVVLQPTASIGSVGSLTLPKFTQFLSGAVNGVNYNFITNQAYTAQLNSANGTYGSYDFIGVEIYEGTPQSQIFNVTNDTIPQEFILPDTGIDTTTLEVIVQTSQSNTATQNYTLATDATSIDETSPVYYLDEYTNGQYKIYFGDDIIGKSLAVGNIVIVNYVVTNGTLANGANTFTLMSSSIPNVNVSVTSVVAASGGADPESINSIKFSAPKSYAAQNRAVTKNDYIALLNKKYPYFDAISVWGGDEVDPPVYGKVFISAKPKLGYVTTEAEKLKIVNEIIKPYSVMTVTPEIVDPDYTFFNITLNVLYDPKQLTTDTGTLTSGITSAVYNYVNSNLNTFNASFYVSQVLRAVDNSNQSIVASELSFFLEKRFSPSLNEIQNITLNYENELQRFSGLRSTGIYSSPGFTVYDSSNILREAYIEEVPQSFTGVTSVEITDSGTGYKTIPTVTIVGDGSGATAVATVVNGGISKINITNGGSEYTTAKVLITGDCTRQAVATPVINGSTGILRTYYYDSNNIKRVLNTNAGTVDYVNGIVTLVGFNPQSVNSTDGQLSLHAKTVDLNVFSNKNVLLTMDSGDPSAITVTVTPISTR